MMKRTCIINENIKCGSKHSAIQAAAPDNAVPSYSWWDHCHFFLPALHYAEDNQGDAEDHEQGDDAPVAPGPFCPAPFDSEEEADNACTEEYRAFNIELNEALL